MQLSHLGIRLLIINLTISTLFGEGTCRRASLEAAIMVGLDVIDFLERLTMADYETYWLSCRFSQTLKPGHALG